jgi:hypothetical protein
VLHPQQAVGGARVNCTTCHEPLGEESRPQHPTCRALDVAGDDVAAELFGIMRAGIIGQPRSAQRMIGPSEIGVPCDRRLGYRMAGTEQVNRTDEVAWKPFIGTAAHEQFADMLARHEASAVRDTGQRWHVEERVSVGTVMGVPVTGTCDVFDAHTGTVADWKFTTRNKIREDYRTHGPGEQYRVQAHLYGRGWQRAGYEVRTVMILFLTRDGEFTDRHVWHETYDEQVAVTALERLSSIATAIEHLGPEFTLPTLPTADAWCRYCPWFKASSTDISRSCPGHPQEAQVPPSLTQLIGA